MKRAMQPPRNTDGSVGAVGQRHADRRDPASATPGAASPLEGLLRIVAEEARGMIGAQVAMASLALDGDPAQALHVVSPPGTQTEAQPLPDPASSTPPGSRSPRGPLAVPLLGPQGRTLGLLRLSHKLDGEFTAEDEARLVHFSRIAAAAVEQALRCREAEAAGQAKAQSLAGLLHELRNPLNAIFLWGRILRQHARNENEAALQEALDTIERNTKRLAHLLEKVDPFSAA